MNAILTIIAVVIVIILTGGYFVACGVLGAINEAAEAEEELLRFNNE